MGSDDTPARRRRGAISAVTALAVSTAFVVELLVLVVLVTGTNADVSLADEAPPPPTAERTGTAPQGAVPSPVAPAPKRVTATPPAPRALERAAPTSIVIPALDVDAEVMEVGLHDDGTLEVPPHAARPESKAGWFRPSPTPGEVGPSVIVGHVDSDRHGPSVFYGLDSLTSGERVEVRRADGRTAVFEVEHVAQYGKDEFPTGDVYGNINHAGLRLITCGGVFDTANRTYTDNIVVYARLVASHDTAHEEQR